MHQEVCICLLSCRRNCEETRLLAVFAASCYLCWLPLLCAKTEGAVMFDSLPDPASKLEGLAGKRPIRRGPRGSTKYSPSSCCQPLVGGRKQPTGRVPSSNARYTPQQLFSPEETGQYLHWGRQRSPVSLSTGQRGRGIG